MGSFMTYLMKTLRQTLINVKTTIRAAKRAKALMA
jgi:hypothetical protein